MKKLFTLLVVLCSLCFISCVTPSTAEANKHRQLIDITVYNDCPWQLKIGLMQKNTTKWQYHTIGKEPVTVTVYMDADYLMGFKGTYDSSMVYYNVSTNNNSVWHIKWSTYTASYTISESNPIY